MTEFTPEKIIEIFKSTNHFGNDQGVQIQVSEDGNYFQTMTTVEKHLSSPGICHGGAVSAFMDSVLGFAALYEGAKDKKLCSTVEYKINFIKPVYLGDKLKGIGHIEYKGNSLVVVSGEIVDDKSGEIKAKGLGTFNLYPYEKKEFINEYLQRS
ncbi:MAG: PaaI family thioesterase [Bacteriovoracaceae bacterium]|jgi:uncharacterized protein (TIGR00369 family)|nr:PaaI family thioesterase [Bacteriovoracaceae bacterium]